MARVDLPIFTEVHEEESFYPEVGAVYLFAPGGEQRGRIEAEWRAARPSVSFVEVKRQEQQAVSFVRSGTEEETFSTRAGRRLRAFIDSFTTGATVYIDITGMSYSTWAPLLRACLESGRATRAVYIEPYVYTKSPTPTEGDIYDLSEGVEGIRALPGFVRLARPSAAGECFIPLLGFEGTRFAHVREHVQPGEFIVPVIGVPGFRPDFPFAAYLGNRPALSEARAWTKVRYARANCPFSLYYLLEEIRDEHSGRLLKVAPIGTKPHGLGAVLFALMNPTVTELVYDHPVRKAGRTEGKSRLLVYRVSEFVS